MFNKQIISGNLGKAPTLTYKDNGTAEARFNICNTAKYKDKQTGEVKESKFWLHCVAYGKRAEMIAKEFNKGDRIILMGSLRGYEKEDEETGYKTTILYHLVNDIEFGSKSLKDSPELPEEPEMPETPDMTEDDIPF